MPAYVIKTDPNLVEGLLRLDSLMMFGVPVLMLDQFELKDESSLLESPFNFWLLDLTYTQYMLALDMSSRRTTSTIRRQNFASASS